MGLQQTRYPERSRDLSLRIYRQKVLLSCYITLKFTLYFSSLFFRSLPMQFFDLSRQFKLSDILSPTKTLNELGQQEWFLAKVRVEHDCLSDSEQLEGQVVLQSNENIQLELEWLIQDTGFELQVLFKGVETAAEQETLVMVKGAQLVDDAQQPLSAQALSLWIDGTLLPMLPQIRKEIKARLNLWDYVEYEA